MPRLPKKAPGPPRQGDQELTGFAKGVVAIVALALVLCGGSFVLNALSTPREVTPEPEDRLGLITGGDLEKFFRGLHVDPKDEVIVRKKGLFGQWELKYEFSVVSTGGGMAYISSTQHILGSEFRADKTYTEMEIGLGLALRLGVGEDVHKVERDDILSWGDQSSYSLIEAQGATIGSLLRVRQGKRVIMFMSVGIFLDDYIVADEILGPLLDRAFAYDPGSKTVAGELGPIPSTINAPISSGVPDNAAPKPAPLPATTP